MKYVKIIPRLKELIGLEVFVFVTFLGICGLINLIIVRFIPNVQNKFWNVILGILEVGLSGILVVIWLVIWYILTKRLMNIQVKKSTKEKN